MNLDQHVGKIVTAQELEKLLDGMPLLKFIYDDDWLYATDYKIGLNECSLPIDQSGIDFLTLKDWHLHCDDSVEMAQMAHKVIVPPDAMILIESGFLICNKIILEESVPRCDLLKNLFSEYIQYLIKQYGREEADKTVIQLVKNYFYTFLLIDQKYRSDELMHYVVSHDGLMLRFIDPMYRTEKLVTTAIKQNSLAKVLTEKRKIKGIDKTV